jgi:hypothetical protein
MSRLGVSARVRSHLAARRKFEEEEARRVEPAIAKMDADRDFIEDIERSRPGPERQQAVDRYNRHRHGGRRLKPKDSDVRVIVSDDSSSFEEAMESARDARDAVLAGADPTGNDFKVEGWA